MNLLIHFSPLSHSMNWGNAKIVIQVKYCTMLLNEHILIAQDPRGNKLHSHSKHSGFIYWPWRVLFIQIEIKRQRGRKSFPGLIYLHEVNRSHRENITLPTTEIMSLFSLTGLLTHSPHDHSKGPRPVKQRKTTSPFCKLAENVHWGVMICILWVLMSIKVAVMELVGWWAQRKGEGGAASLEQAVKSLGPQGPLYVTQLLHLLVACRAHRPTFWNVSAIKPDGFNVLDLVVSNAISFNPICGEIALER